MAENTKPKTAAAEAIRKTAGGGGGGGPIPPGGGGPPGGGAPPPPGGGGPPGGDQFGGLASSLERLSAALEKIQGVAQGIRNVFAEINALSAKTANSIEQLSANFEHINRSVSSLHESLSAGRATLKHYTSAVDSLSSSVENLNKKVRELHSSLGKFGSPPGGSGRPGPSGGGSGGLPPSGGPLPSGGSGRAASDAEATGASTRRRATRRTRSAADDETIEHAHIRYYRRSGAAADERRRAVDDLLNRARSAIPPVSRQLVSKSTPRQREARSRLWSTIGTLGAIGASIALPPLLSAFSVSPAVISAVVGAVGAIGSMFSRRAMYPGGVVASRVSDFDIDEDDMQHLRNVSIDEIDEEAEDDAAKQLRKRRRKEAFELEQKLAPRLRGYVLSLDAYKKLRSNLSKYMENLPREEEVPPPQTQKEIKKLPKTLFRYADTDKPVWQWTPEDEKQLLPAQMSPFVTYYMSRLFPWAPLTPRRSEWTEAQSRGYSMLSGLMNDIAEKKKVHLRIIRESRAELAKALEGTGYTNLRRVIKDAGIGPELLLGLAETERLYKNAPQQNESVKNILSKIESMRESIFDALGLKRLSDVLRRYFQETGAIEFPPSRERVKKKQKTPEEEREDERLLSTKLAASLLNSLGMPADEADVDRLASLGSAHLKNLLRYLGYAGGPRIEPLGWISQEMGGRFFKLYDEPILPQDPSGTLWVETEHGKVLEKRFPAFTMLRSIGDLEALNKERQRTKAKRGLDKLLGRSDVVRYIGSIIVRSLVTGTPLREAMPHHLRPFASSVEYLASQVWQKAVEAFSVNVHEVRNRARDALIKESLRLKPGDQTAAQQAEEILKLYDENELYQTVFGAPAEVFSGQVAPISDLLRKYVTYVLSGQPVIEEISSEEKVKRKYKPRIIDRTRVPDMSMVPILAEHSKFVKSLDALVPEGADRVEFFKSYLGKIRNDVLRSAAIVSLATGRPIHALSNVQNEFLYELDAIRSSVEEAHSIAKLLTTVRQSGDLMELAEKYARPYMSESDYGELRKKIAEFKPLPHGFPDVKLEDIRRTIMAAWATKRAESVVSALVARERRVWEEFYAKGLGEVQFRPDLASKLAEPGNVQEAARLTIAGKGSISALDKAVRPGVNITTANPWARKFFDKDFIVNFLMSYLRTHRPGLAKQYDYDRLRNTLNAIIAKTPFEGVMIALREKIPLHRVPGMEIGRTGGKFDFSEQYAEIEKARATAEKIYRDFASAMSRKDIVEKLSTEEYARIFEGPGYGGLEKRLMALFESGVSDPVAAARARNLLVEEYANVQAKRIAASIKKKEHEIFHAFFTGQLGEVKLSKRFLNTVQFDESGQKRSSEDAARVLSNLIAMTASGRLSPQDILALPPPPGVASIVARHLERRLTTESNLADYITPPGFGKEEIPGYRIILTKRDIRYLKDRDKVIQAFKEDIGRAFAALDSLRTDILEKSGKIPLEAITPEHEAVDFRLAPSIGLHAFLGRLTEYLHAAQPFFEMEGLPAHVAGVPELPGAPKAVIARDRNFLKEVIKPLPTSIVDWEEAHRAFLASIRELSESEKKAKGKVKTDVEAERILSHEERMLEVAKEVHPMHLYPILYKYAEKSVGAFIRPDYAERVKSIRDVKLGWEDIPAMQRYYMRGVWGYGGFSKATPAMLADLIKELMSSSKFRSRRRDFYAVMIDAIRSFVPELADELVQGKYEPTQGFEERLISELHKLQLKEVAVRQKRSKGWDFLSIAQLPITQQHKEQIVEAILKGRMPVYGRDLRRASIVPDDLIAESVFVTPHGPVIRHGDIARFLLSGDLLVSERHLRRRASPEFRALLDRIRELTSGEQLFSRVMPPLPQEVFASLVPSEEGGQYAVIQGLQRALSSAAAAKARVPGASQAPTADLAGGKLRKPGGKQSGRIRWPLLLGLTGLTGAILASPFVIPALSSFAASALAFIKGILPTLPAFDPISAISGVMAGVPLAMGIKGSGGINLGDDDDESGSLDELRNVRITDIPPVEEEGAAAEPEKEEKPKKRSKGSGGKRAAKKSGAGKRDTMAELADLARQSAAESGTGATGSVLNDITSEVHKVISSIRDLFSSPGFSMAPSGPEPSAEAEAAPEAGKTRKRASAAPRKRSDRTEAAEESEKPREAPRGGRVDKKVGSASAPQLDEVEKLSAKIKDLRKEIEGLAKQKDSLGREVKAMQAELDKGMKEARKAAAARGRASAGASGGGAGRGSAGGGAIGGGGGDEDDERGGRRRRRGGGVGGGDGGGGGGEERGDNPIVKILKLALFADVFGVSSAVRDQVQKALELIPQSEDEKPDYAQLRPYAQSIYAGVIAAISQKFAVAQPIAESMVAYGISLKHETLPSMKNAMKKAVVLANKLATQSPGEVTPEPSFAWLSALMEATKSAASGVSRDPILAYGLRQAMEKPAANAVRKSLVRTIARGAVDELLRTGTTNLLGQVELKFRDIAAGTGITESNIAEMLGAQGFDEFTRLIEVYVANILGMGGTLPPSAPEAIRKEIQGSFRALAAAVQMRGRLRKEQVDKSKVDAQKHRAAIDEQVHRAVNELYQKGETLLGGAKITLSDILPPGAELPREHDILAKQVRDVLLASSAIKDEKQAEQYIKDSLRYRLAGLVSRSRSRRSLTSEERLINARRQAEALAFAASIIGPDGSGVGEELTGEGELGGFKFKASEIAHEGKIPSSTRALVNAARLALVAGESFQGDDEKRRELMQDILKLQIKQAVVAENLRYIEEQRVKQERLAAQLAERRAAAEAAALKSQASGYVRELLSGAPVSIPMHGGAEGKTGEGEGEAEPKSIEISEKDLGITKEDFQHYSQLVNAMANVLRKARLTPGGIDKDAVVEELRSALDAARNLSELRKMAAREKESASAREATSAELERMRIYTEAMRNIRTGRTPLKNLENEVQAIRVEREFASRGPEEARRRGNEFRSMAAELEREEIHFRRLRISWFELLRYMGRVFVGLHVFDFLRGVLSHAYQSSIGFALQKQTAVVGITATNLTLSRYVDQVGKVLPMNEQLAVSFAQVTNEMKQFQIYAMRMGVPVGQLIEGYQVAAGVARFAGFTGRDTIRAVSGLVALSQMLNISLSTLARTIDNVFTGQRIAQVTLGRMLGLDERTVRSWISTGKFKERLLERLEPVEQAVRELGEKSIVFQFSRAMSSAATMGGNLVSPFLNIATTAMKAVAQFTETRAKGILLRQIMEEPAGEPTLWQSIKAAAPELLSLGAFFLTWSTMSKLKMFPPVSQVINNMQMLRAEYIQNARAAGRYPLFSRTVALVQHLRGGMAAIRDPARVGLPADESRPAGAIMRMLGASSLAGSRSAAAIGSAIQTGSFLLATVIGASLANPLVGLAIQFAGSIAATMIANRYFAKKDKENIMNLIHAFDFITKSMPDFSAPRSELARAMAQMRNDDAALAKHRDMVSKTTELAKAMKDLPEPTKPDIGGGQRRPQDSTDLKTGVGTGVPLAIPELRRFIKAERDAVVAETIELMEEGTLRGPELRPPARATRAIARKKAVATPVRGGRAVPTQRPQERRQIDISAIFELRKHATGEVASYEIGIPADREDLSAIFALRKHAMRESIARDIAQLRDAVFPVPHAAPTPGLFTPGAPRRTPAPGAGGAMSLAFPPPHAAPTPGPFTPSVPQRTPPASVREVWLSALSSLSNFLSRHLSPPPTPTYEVTPTPTPRGGLVAPPSPRPTPLPIPLPTPTPSQDQGDAVEGRSPLEFAQRLFYVVHDSALAIASWAAERVAVFISSPSGTVAPTPTPTPRPRRSLPSPRIRALDKPSFTPTPSSQEIQVSRDLWSGVVNVASIVARWTMHRIIGIGSGVGPTPTPTPPPYRIRALLPSPGPAPTPTPEPTAIPTKPTPGRIPPLPKPAPTPTRVPTSRPMPFGAMAPTPTPTPTPLPTAGFVTPGPGDINVFSVRGYLFGLASSVLSSIAQLFSATVVSDKPKRPTPTPTPTPHPSQRRVPLRAILPVARAVPTPSIATPTPGSDSTDERGDFWSYISNAIYPIVQWVMESFAGPDFTPRPTPTPLPPSKRFLTPLAAAAPTVPLAPTPGPGTSPVRRRIPPKALAAPTPSVYTPTPGGGAVVDASGGLWSYISETVSPFAEWFLERVVGIDMTPRPTPTPLPPSKRVLTPVSRLLPTVPQSPTPTPGVQLKPIGAPGGAAQPVVKGMPGARQPTTPSEFQLPIFGAPEPKSFIIGRKFMKWLLFGQHPIASPRALLEQEYYFARPDLLEQKAPAPMEKKQLVVGVKPGGAGKDDFITERRQLDDIDYIKIWLSGVRHAAESSSEISDEVKRYVNNLLRILEEGVKAQRELVKAPEKIAKMRDRFDVHQASRSFGENLKTVQETVGALGALTEMLRDEIDKNIEDPKLAKDLHVRLERLNRIKDQFQGTLNYFSDSMVALEQEQKAVMASMQYRIALIETQANYAQMQASLLQRRGYQVNINDVVRSIMGPVQEAHRAQLELLGAQGTFSGLEQYILQAYSMPISQLSDLAFDRKRFEEWLARMPNMVSSGAFDQYLERPEVKKFIEEYAGGAGEEGGKMSLEESRNVASEMLRNIGDRASFEAYLEKLKKDQGPARIELLRKMREALLSYVQADFAKLFMQVASMKTDLEFANAQVLADRLGLIAQERQFAAEIPLATAMLGMPSQAGIGFAKPEMIAGISARLRNALNVSMARRKEAIEKAYAIEVERARLMTGMAPEILQAAQRRRELQLAQLYASEAERIGFAESLIPRATVARLGREMQRFEAEHALRQAEATAIPGPYVSERRRVAIQIGLSEASIAAIAPMVGRIDEAIEQTRSNIESLRARAAAAGEGTPEYLVLQSVILDQQAGLEQMELQRLGLIVRERQETARLYELQRELISQHPLYTGLKAFQAGGMFGLFRGFMDRYADRGIRALVASVLGIGGGRQESKQGDDLKKALAQAKEKLSDIFGEKSGISGALGSIISGASEAASGAGTAYAVLQGVSATVDSIMSIQDRVRALKSQAGWTLSPKRFEREAAGAVLDPLGLGGLGRKFGQAGVFGSVGALAGGAIGAIAGGPIGAAIGAAAGGLITGAIGGVLGAFGIKLFKSPTPPSRLRRGLQRIFDEMGIPRIAEGGRGIDLDYPSASPITSDVAGALGLYMRYRYFKLGELHLLPARMISAVSAAAASMGLRPEDAERLSRDLTKKIVPSLDAGVMALLALHKRGTIGMNDLVKGAGGLLRVFNDLPPAINANALALTLLGNDGKKSILALTRAAQDAAALISSGLPEAIQNAVEAGGSFVQFAQNIGIKFADIFISRVSERLLQRPEIGDALSQMVAKAETAAELLAQGRMNEYMRVMNEVVAMFAMAQGQLTTQVAPILNALTAMKTQFAVGPSAGIIFNALTSGYGQYSVSSFAQLPSDIYSYNQRSVIDDAGLVAAYKRAAREAAREFAMSIAEYTSHGNQPMPGEIVLRIGDDDTGYAINGILERRSKFYYNGASPNMKAGLE